MEESGRIIFFFKAAGLKIMHHNRGHTPRLDIVVCEYKINVLLIKKVILQRNIKIFSQLYLIRPDLPTQSL